MPKVFISYRREDSAGFAGRVFDQLESRFGRGSVFMDVDAIPFGVDFRNHLADAVNKCDVLLAIIGDRWAAIGSDGHSQLHDPKDFVRIEIEAALARNVRVIPVLVGRTLMPREEVLPPSLQPLAYRNACNLDSGPDFHVHLARLIRGLEQIDTGMNTGVVLGMPSQPQSTDAPDAMPYEKWIANHGDRFGVQVASGPAQGTTYELTKERVLIGRSPDCDIALDVGAMSRYHAQFVLTKDGFWFEDLGTRNGSYVNGHSVVGRRVPLNDGDRIHTGAVILIYRRLGQMGVTA